jgi:hypothetical protein
MTGIKKWPFPKSICTCGHAGDGRNSNHKDSGFAPGHGACNVAGCQCRQFTWNNWTPAFQDLLNEEKLKRESLNS